MKTKLFLLASLVALFVSCNPDVQLFEYEDTPKVAEHLLGLTKSQAEEYLAQQGFFFGRKMDYVDEFVYSKDKNLSEFSYDASIMLMFGTRETDTVYYVSSVQRMQTQKSAYDLYWKWSHYTAFVTKPKYTFWSGNVGSGYYITGEQEQFWAEYKNIGDELKKASEWYRNEGENVQPKEIELWVNMNNGGRIELAYETQSFVAKSN